MVKIDNLGSDASQLTSIILDDGSVLTVTLIFRAAILRWCMDIAWPGPAAAPFASPFQIFGINLCVSPNILRPWRDVLPFGIGCTAKDGVDPVDVTDFDQDRVQLYVLNESDVSEVERAIYGGPS